MQRQGKEALPHENGVMDEMVYLKDEAGFLLFEFTHTGC